MDLATLSSVTSGMIKAHENDLVQSVLIAYLNPDNTISVLRLGSTMYVNNKLANSLAKIIINKKKPIEYDTCLINVIGPK
jgi:hypothetical protein